MVFVPLTTISMDPIPRERMGNATSLFNLMRNLGGGIGIAATSTMLARRSQSTRGHPGSKRDGLQRRRAVVIRRAHARRSSVPAAIR
jgi:hypothetical protein